MKFILGQKEKMTQFFDDNGQVIPGTIVSAGPIRVLAKKNGKQDGGQESIMVGYGKKKLSGLKKPQKEMIKKVLSKNITDQSSTDDEIDGFAVIKEFNCKDSKWPEEIKVGQIIDVSLFTEGDKIVVSAISKSKGFQGVVKRHGFHGGRRSHGQKHSEREPGSIGAGGQQRVMPGLRMAGRMGGDRVTVKNLIISRVDKDNNRLFIKGAIPGRKGTLVEIISK